MNKWVKVIQGDITKMKTDAIVNAANTTLLGGGGVDGAIHRAGGKLILEDCLKIREKQGGCKTGEAVITRAGNLPSKHVIHTVGPVWNGGNRNEKQLLANAYANSLKVTMEHNLRTVAFPSISTGVYGFPKMEAAKIAIATVKDFVSLNSLFDEIIFVCFDDENFKIYSELLK